MEMEPGVAEKHVDGVETPDIDFDNLPIDDWLETAEEWVRDNRTLALVGSFAVGVFIGVMLRD